jgi:hypothetical protein
MTVSDVQLMMADAIDNNDGFTINLCRRALGGDEEAWQHLSRDHRDIVGTLQDMAPRGDA